MPMAQVRKRGGELAMNKYKERFPNVVELRDGEKGQEVRLQPLEKVKSLLEEPGKFLMIQAEEITDRFPSVVNGKPTTLPVHMNATNIGQVIKPQGGNSVREVISNNVRAVQEQAKQLNRPILPHLNHPNFQWGVSASDLAEAVEEEYFEVFNGHPGVNQLGDATRPSVERMWDIVNTIRLAQLDAKPVRGLGTDDAHHYHVPGMKRSTAGRGWVLVRAKELSPEAIVNAMAAGDFYASSGVTLADVTYDAGAKTLKVAVKAEADATYTIAFVGTPRISPTAAKRRSIRRRWERPSRRWRGPRRATR
jgi:hypothetical protein